MSTSAATKANALTAAKEHLDRHAVIKTRTPMKKWMQQQRAPQATNGQELKEGVAF